MPTRHLISKRVGSSGCLYDALEVTEAHKSTSLGVLFEYYRVICWKSRSIRLGCRYMRFTILAIL
jgi:hypothetical protein